MFASHYTLLRWVENSNSENILGGKQDNPTQEKINILLMRRGGGGGGNPNLLMLRI
jgi:hypothetical protein